MKTSGDAGRRHGDQRRAGALDDAEGRADHRRPGRQREYADEHIRGAKLVHEAGQTMKDIVASIKQVEEIMARIAGASNEQASGIEQVNQTLTQMDDVTQQNAALVEQSNASMEALQRQAEELAATIRVFKVAAEEPAPSAPEPVTADEVKPAPLLPAYAVARERRAGLPRQ